MPVLRDPVVTPKLIAVSKHPVIDGPPVSPSGEISSRTKLTDP